MSNIILDQYLLRKTNSFIVLCSKTFQSTFSDELKKVLSEADIIQFGPEDGIKVLRDKISLLNIKPHSSQFRALIILDGELLTEQQSNTILKTLEEPPEYSKIFILSQSTSSLLPTVKSRCSIIKIDSEILSNDGMFSGFEDQSFNGFVKFIKDNEENLPHLIRNTLEEIKEKGLNELRGELFKKLYDLYVMSLSTNVNLKLGLEDVYIWWLSRNK